MSLTLSIFTSLNQVSYENEIIMVQSKTFFVARRLKPLTPDDLSWIKTFWLLSKIEGPINRESYDGITEKQEAKNLSAKWQTFTVHKPAFRASPHLSAFITKTLDKTF